MPRPAKSGLSIYAQAERVERLLAKLEAKKEEILASASKDVMAFIELKQKLVDKGHK